MANDTSERNSTPSSFAPQGATAEDVLKQQTIGLVTNADFRKRRAEAEQRLQSGTDTPRSGSKTPQSGVTSLQRPKKKRKTFTKGKLSFGLDDDDEEASSKSAVATPQPATPNTMTREVSVDEGETSVIRKRGPNKSVANAPKAMTKSAMKNEAEMREKLRKEFLVIQEAVKATEIAIPFVFYDGTNIPGGICRIKKGDHIWLFLDRARKVGAELGVGGDKSKREWARVGVDDLMLVRGEIIIPHHFEFYYFIINKTMGFNGRLFNYSAEADKESLLEHRTAGVSYDPLARPSKDNGQKQHGPLEGKDDDPNITKVVDRRWYERNKHIFPASVWEEFDPTKDYTTGIRKDTQGNAFFFS